LNGILRAKLEGCQQENAFLKNRPVITFEMPESECRSTIGGMGRRTSFCEPSPTGLPLAGEPG